MRKVNHLYKEETDEQLVMLLCQGDVAAFEELYERYVSKMIRYISYLLGNNRKRAEDLVQDIFIRIIEQPQQFKKGYKFSTWIYTIAGNQVKNEVRNSNTRSRIEEELHGEHSFITIPDIRALDLQILKDKIHIELEQYHTNHKTTFLLKYMEELSVKEIAEIMNCSEGTVKSRLFYTLKKLSEKMKIYQGQL